MKYEISDDRKRLAIFVTPEEQEYLRNWNDEEPSLAFTGAEGEFLEPLIANSELEWINPAETGDLTDAPMLGVLCDDPDMPGESSIRVLERWAFMDYQVRSVLEDLRDKGQCVFVS